MATIKRQYYLTIKWETMNTWLWWPSVYTWLRKVDGRMAYGLNIQWARFVFLINSWR